MSNVKPTILDGRHVRAERSKILTERIKGLSMKPTLAIVQVGDRIDSNTFISAKRKFAEKIGVAEKYIRIAESASTSEIIRIVGDLDSDPAIHGIIVQLPLPLAVDRDAVFSAISAGKDVDGLTAANIQKWLEGREDAMWPATVRGIRELLHFYGISLSGKHVVIVGRSSLVGKPAAAMCLAEDATVTVCHSRTQNLAAHTQTADILIVAIGKLAYIGASHITTGQVVIDVGINKHGEHIGGDVDFEAVQGRVAAITPVPGGVGPLTVLALFENLVDACYNLKN